MPIFKNFTKPRNLIVNYMKQIEQNLIPSLNSSLDININNYPKVEKETYAIYEDSNKHISIELSCNHRDIEQRDQLFATVTYNNMRVESGLISLSDIDDAVEIITISLKDLGFKTPQDIEEEKRKAEEEKKAEEERKAKEQEERKTRNAANLTNSNDSQELDNAEDEGDTEQPELDEYNNEKPMFLNELDSTINFVSDLDGNGQTITIEWLTPINTSNTSFNMGHIYVILTHISGKNFLLENKKIKPKLEKSVNPESAISYIEKVSDKLNQVPNISVKDENGKDIEIPEDYNDTILDLDI